MSIKLRELIRKVRSCKTAAEERGVIAKECALIRTAIAKQDGALRHRNVAKLLYIHMLGYPTHFGQLECLKLIADPLFIMKRIGYLGLMILLDEKQEILMLVTNSLKKYGSCLDCIECDMAWIICLDVYFALCIVYFVLCFVSLFPSLCLCLCLSLSSAHHSDFHDKNRYIRGLSLASMGNICSSDMARDLANDVEGLLKDPEPYIRKKAALCAIRAVRKVPELTEDFVNPAINMLTDKNHAVLLGAMQLIIELITRDASVTDEFRKLVPLLVGILKKLVLAGFVAEYDVCGITDPFLQCRIIQLLRLLGKSDAKASSEMNDILAQVAINTEPTKNPGNAILYECVQTIMAIEAEAGLRVLAVNILGRFLLNRDNNIRYVALNTLCKVVNSDTKAVQRHRNLVVDCLKDPDISIRRRALELIYALVTKSNVRALVKELLNYLSLASGDREFKADLTDKITVVVDRFAPSKRWHIDTLIQVLGTAGAYVKENVSVNLITLVAGAKPLHAYSAHQAYRALLEQKTTFIPPLVEAGIWCIGEYGQHLVTDSGVAKASDHAHDDVTFEKISEHAVLEMLDGFMRHPDTNNRIREYVLNALVKLSARFSQESDYVTQLVSTYATSMHVELQQRSVEYSVLCDPSLKKIRMGVVNTMPAFKTRSTDSKDDEFTESESEETESDSDEEEEEEDIIGASAAADAAAVTTDASTSGTNTVNILDGLDFLSDSFAPTNGNGAAPSAEPAPAATSSAVDLFDIFAPSNTTTTTAAPATAAPIVSSTSSSSVDPLDLLMGGPVQTTSAPVQAPVVMPMSVPVAASPSENKSRVPPLNVLQKDNLKIVFNFKKVDSSKTQVQAVFTNSGASSMTGFDFKIAVPKYIKIRIKPASSAVVPSNGNGRVTQLFELDNTMAGQKNLALKIRADFTQNGQAKMLQAQVSNFPAELNQ
jgi:AP-1 complex subunit gamma-1